MKPVTFPSCFPLFFVLRLLAGRLVLHRHVRVVAVLASSTSRSCISASARLYSFGNTLTNFWRARPRCPAVLARALAAGPAVVVLQQLLQLRFVGLVAVQILRCTLACLLGRGQHASSDTIERLQRLANWPSSS
jgi:hypothetical protein